MGGGAPSSKRPRQVHCEELSMRRSLRDFRIANPHPVGRALRTGLAAAGAFAATIASATPSPLPSTASIRSQDSGQAAPVVSSFSAIYYSLTPAKDANPEAVPAEALLKEFLDKHSAMDYQGAAELALRLANLIPDRPEGHYNYACALARLHRDDEALVALEAAIDHGWRDLDHLKLDPDLRGLRNEEGFLRLIDKLKALIQQDRIVAGPLRIDPLEIVVKDLDRAAAEAIESRRLPGMSIALIRDGQVVWTGAYGVRDRRSSQALTVDDRFAMRPAVHALALLAGEQLQQANETSLAEVLMRGVEFDRSGGDLGDLQDRPLTVTPGSVPRITTINARGLGGRTSDRCVVERLPNYAGGGVFGFLKLWIETVSEDSFAGYCKKTLLAANRMDASSLRDDPANEDGGVIGHSRLGSPMVLSSDAKTKAGCSLNTTASDAAKLMLALAHRPQASLERSEPDAAPVAAQPDASSAGASNAGASKPVADRLAGSSSSRAGSVMSGCEQAAKVSAAVPGGLGLGVGLRRTEYGACIEMADVCGGMGCLARWYQSSGNGIVILYNAEDGADAARRLAHIALGGE